MVVAETLAQAQDGAEARRGQLRGAALRARSARGGREGRAGRVGRDARTTSSSIRGSAIARRPTPRSPRPTTSSSSISTSRASPPRRWSRAPRSAITMPARAAGNCTWAAAAPCARRARSPPCSASTPKDVRVQTYDVGGNFGSKNRVYVEYGLVLWASRKVGRPVKYVATRHEAFISDYQGRDLATRVELALSKDGKLPRSCAATTSATPARAACRCRRSARARALSRAPTTFPRRRCARAPYSPTRRRRRPIAAPAVPR